MGQHFKHGSPHEQLRRHLEASRAAGLSFDEAWHAALRAPSSRGVGIYIPHNTIARRSWMEAFEATRAEWQRCYEGTPSTVSAALSRLLEAMVEDASRPVAMPGPESPPMAHMARVEMTFVGRAETRRRDPVEVFEAAA